MGGNASRCELVYAWRIPFETTRSFVARDSGIVRHHFYHSSNYSHQARAQKVKAGASMQGVLSQFSSLVLESGEETPGYFKPVQCTLLHTPPNSSLSAAFCSKVRLDLTLWLKD